MLPSFLYYQLNPEGMDQSQAQLKQKNNKTENNANVQVHFCNLNAVIFLYKKPQTCQKLQMPDSQKCSSVKALMQYLVL